MSRRDDTHFAGHHDPGAEVMAVLFEELFQTVEILFRRKQVNALAD